MTDAIPQNDKEALSSLSKSESEVCRTSRCKPLITMPALTVMELIVAWKSTVPSNRW